MFKSLTAWAHWSAAHPTESVRAQKRKNRGRGSPSRRTHRRRPPEAEATERVGEGVREARGGQAQLDGELTDGGEEWVNGNIVDRGGRAAVGDEHHNAGHQLTGRGRLRTPGDLDWSRGEKMEAERLSSGGILTGGRAAVVSSSPAIRGFPGANTGGGGN